MTGIHAIQTALGTIQATFDGQGAVIYLGIADHEFRAPLLAKLARLAPDPHPSAAVVARLRNQLDEYAGGWRSAFSVPFHLHGSPFEQRVWQQLLAIPCGETRSCGQLARRLGDPNLSRAVGRANGANGTLTGYAGGSVLKRQLLELEGAIKP